MRFGFVQGTIADAMNQLDEQVTMLARHISNSLVILLLVFRLSLAADAPVVRIALIGDSLTHASVSQQQIAALCEKPENPKLSLVGSHGPGDVPGVIRHESYARTTACIRRSQDMTRSAIRCTGG
jgi:hypothetical protein